MRSERRSPLPLALALGSPLLAAAVTVATAVISRGLPPVKFIGLNHFMDGRVVLANTVLAFAGGAAGGLLARGGPVRRSALALAAGTSALALDFALLVGVFALTWTD